MTTLKNHLKLMYFHLLLRPVLILQRLVHLFLREETVRVITAGNAILQKGHVYEVLADLQQAAGALSEREPTQVYEQLC